MNPHDIAKRITTGEMRAAARLMRDLDDGEPGAVEVLKILYHQAGKAYVVGITGSPGVGKSTLTDALVTRFRKNGKTVGVVAVDPTSPFTGGAILGDRVRMQRHATDDGVFIRSLATRGQFGGLTASTRGVVTVMDAMGKDVILVETVGVGQDEVDIVRMADTTVVVTVPGLGDDVQAIKAGILEVGDVFVVNKTDREGAATAMNQLMSMLALEREGSRRRDWEPPVVGTCALEGRGLDELLAAVASHREHLEKGGGELLQQRRQERARMELVDIIQVKALKLIQSKLETGGLLDELAGEIARGSRDPYSISEEIMAAAFGEES